MSKILALVGDEGPGIENGERHAEAHVLGSGEPPRVTTGGSWITDARLAFFKQRDAEHARRRELILALANTVQEVLGLDLETRRLTGPEIVIDDVHLMIREFILPQPGIEREFRLAVAVACPFCERENWREFGSKEELGQILCEPTGGCSFCQKPLASRPGGAC